MSRAFKLRPVFLLLLTALGCSSSPSGPSTGSLKVTVSGLPVGTPAAVAVTGPGGFNQTVSATQTLADLAPGSYTVAAGNVTVSGTAYSANPASQVLTVNGGSTTVGTVILYSTASTNLTVTITGLGTNTNADVSVTGPNSYSQALHRHDHARESHPRRLHHHGERCDRLRWRNLQRNASHSGQDSGNGGYRECHGDLRSSR